MKRHLIIFAKAPRIGQAKRRLAAGIGRVAAWRFQRWALDRTVRRLAFDPRWQCWLFVTGGPARWPRGVRRIRQCRGDIGQRMAHALRAAGPGAAVLIGSDIPDASADHIAAAFRCLAQRRTVFGPASDGGFWLVGQRSSEARRGLFAGVRWSSRFALGDTLANLTPRQRFSLLQTLTDIDDIDALRRWKAGRN